MNATMFATVSFQRPPRVRTPDMRYSLVRAIAVGLVNAIDTIVSHGKAFLGVRSCRPGAAPSLTFLCATLDHAQTCRWMSERPPRHRMAQKGEAFLVSEPVSSTLSRDEIEQA